MQINNDRILATIGLCKKAGFLIYGFDSVKEALPEGKVCLVVLAKDLSPKSAKETRFVADKYNICVITAPFVMDEIWRRVSKRTGILAITNPGLADTIKTAISRTNEED